jgi:hypothetical protein
MTHAPIMTIRGAELKTYVFDGKDIVVQHDRNLGSFATLADLCEVHWCGTSDIRAATVVRVGLTFGNSLGPSTRSCSGCWATPAVITKYVAAALRDVHPPMSFGLTSAILGSRLAGAGRVAAVRSTEDRGALGVAMMDFPTKRQSAIRSRLGRTTSSSYPHGRS